MGVLEQHTHGARGTLRPAEDGCSGIFKVKQGKSTEPKASQRCLWFLPSTSRKSFTPGASQAQTTRHFFILRTFVAPLSIFAPHPSAEEQSQEEAGEVSEELHGELHTPKLPHPATHPPLPDAQEGVSRAAFVQLF